METAEFLRATVTGGAGYFVLAYRNHVEPWQQEWYMWPNDVPTIVQRSAEMKDTHDVYFTSYLFMDRVATRQASLPTSTIQADLDHADTQNLPIAPSILVETSPKHYHAYWFLKQQLERREHERLSKRMTYAIKDADHSGWAIGHRLRVANTKNHKYLPPLGPYDVRVLSAPMHKYTAEDIDLLPAVPSDIEVMTDEDAEHDPFLIAATNNTIDIGQGPLQLLESIKERIPVSVYAAEATTAAPQPDRSAALWALMCSSFTAGLSREAVYWLAWNSPNNKFKQDQRYHAELDLALDVLRAERHVKSTDFDARAMIDAIRMSKAKRFSAHRGIASTVRDVMRVDGEFIKTVSGEVWYLPNNTGRPLEIAKHDSSLNALLEIRFGLNPTELEQSFTVENIKTYTKSLPETATTAVLSHYDVEHNVLLLHTGHRDVARIAADGITRQKNGAANVLFAWEPVFETFSPDLSSTTPGAADGGAAEGLDWGVELFGPLNTITNMSPEEARTVLKVWFLFVLFRNAAEARPILSFFGTPGSGKTHIMRRIYRLLYARRLAVSGITNADDYDHSSSKLPFYGIDNLDSYINWVPDKLAQSICDIDTLKRKLYTNGEIVRMRKQAMVGVTSHNPRFTSNRPDVADRLLLLNFRRVDEGAFLAEGPAYWRIDALRDRLWGAIVADLQNILAQGPPSQNTQISMRVQDFAWLGEWIAAGLGGDALATFRAAVGNTLLAQSSLILQDDEAMITAISTYVANTGGTHGQFVTANELYTRVAEHCPEGAQQQFTKSVRTARAFGAKLTGMFHILSKLFDIEYENSMVARTWKIAPKPTQPPTQTP